MLTVDEAWENQVFRKAQNKGVTVESVDGSRSTFKIQRRLVYQQPRMQNGSLRHKIVGEPSDYRQKSLYWLEIRRREPIILKELGCATTIVGGGDRSDQDCTHGAFCPLWYSVASSLKVNNSASSHDNRE